MEIHSELFRCRMPVEIKGYAAVYCYECCEFLYIKSPDTIGWQNIKCSECGKVIGLHCGPTVYSEASWSKCDYVDFKLKADGWEDGKWYEWMDSKGIVEVARMKFDAIDHFFPDTEYIKEENLFAFREIQKGELNER